MNLSTLCLCLLCEAPMTGYEIHGRIWNDLRHFQHASFGALYPALGKLKTAGFISTPPTGSSALAKKKFQITVTGRSELMARLSRLSGAESYRSEFLSALYFSNHMDLDAVETLINQRLSDHRQIRRHLRGLPIPAMTEGQRFTVRYALSIQSAAIDFLEGEGRAILAALKQERYQ